ncbi:hypothetical protein FKP32DRAFT_294510 [Trametes sanguinea]|nr:hypothetical protein FKP32DRAFT_294510 [Trametes sanguinea]
MPLASSSLSAPRRAQRLCRCFTDTPRPVREHPHANLRAMPQLAIDDGSMAQSPGKKAINATDAWHAVCTHHSTPLRSRNKARSDAPVAILTCSPDHYHAHPRKLKPAWTRCTTPCDPDIPRLATQAHLRHLNPASARFDARDFCARSARSSTQRASWIVQTPLLARHAQSTLDLPPCELSPLPSLLPPPSCPRARPLTRQRYQHSPAYAARPRACSLGCGSPPRSPAGLWERGIGTGRYRS